MQYKLSYHDLQTSHFWFLQQLNILHYTCTDVFTSTVSRLQVVLPTRLEYISPQNQTTLLALKNDILACSVAANIESNPTMRELLPQLTLTHNTMVGISCTIKRTKQTHSPTNGLEASISAPQIDGDDVKLQLHQKSFLVTRTPFIVLSYVMTLEVLNNTMFKRTYQ